MGPPHRAASTSPALQNPTPSDPPNATADDEPNPPPAVETPAAQLLKKALVTIVLAGGFWLCRAIFDPGALAVGPFFDVCILAIFVYNALTQQSRHELRATVLLALVAGVAQFAVYRFIPPNTIVAICDISRLLGLSSLVVTLAVALRARDEQLEPAMRRVLISLIPPCFSIVSMGGIYLSIFFHPTVWDGLLYAFEGTLRFQASFLIGRFILLYLPLRFFCEIIYVLMPLALCLVYSAQRRNPRPPVIDLAAAFVVTTWTGFVVYQLFPASGPAYVYPDNFPWSEPAWQSVPLRQVLDGSDPRNCMPSLHTAWAFLLVWHSRDEALWLRLSMAVVLLFTLLATLGLGEHYLPDLVVAMPFALATQATVAPRSPERLRAMVAGAAITVVWLLLLGSGILLRRPSALVSGGLMLATVIASIELSRQLWQASAAITRAAAPKPC